MPLSAIAKVEQRATQLQIDHLSQFPSATFSFDVAPGYSLGTAVKAIQAAEKIAGPPPGITTQFEGSALAFQSALSNEVLLILAAIITVYIVLGVLYESFIHPVTILSTLPSAGVGALLALIVTGHDLNIVSIIGIILLIGIVKKNAIMMIDFALEAERNEGKAPEEAIHQAALLRFRPILMTTVAALFGALPLMLGSGMGSELRHPLGISIVGGLLVSQLLTLFTTARHLHLFRQGGTRYPRMARAPPGRPCRTRAGAGGMSFSQIFIYRKIATILLALGLGLAGLVAYFLLPVAPYPNIDIPTICGQRQHAGRLARDHVFPVWRRPWSGTWAPLPGSPK